MIRDLIFLSIMIIYALILYTIQNYLHLDDETQIAYSLFLVLSSPFILIFLALPEIILPKSKLANFLTKKII